MTSNSGSRIGWIFKSLFFVALAGTVLAMLGGGIVFWYFSRDLPQIVTVADYRPLGVTRVLGSGGKEDVVLAEFYKERRYLVPYDKIPEIVVQAFIAAEDDQFFEHQGIDFASIIRASIANFKAGHVVQGGSTITQQVAKSLLLTPERSYVRKIKEVILASRIEANLTKQQILYLYLNQIYLGHGAYGVQAASKAYFNKDVSALSIAEAAMLAGMPQAPGKYSPHLNPKRAKDRQLYVLRRLYETRFISESQMSEAAAQALRIYGDSNDEDRLAAYFVEHVRRHLLEKYGEKAVYEEALTVSVPITPEMAKAARESLREGLRAVDKRAGYRGPLRRLKDPDEVENFLKEQRLRLIEKKVGYRLLLPDGRLDTVEAMRDAGIQSDLELLNSGDIQQAVVTSVDDRRKAAMVMVGAIRMELPHEKMKWALSPSSASSSSRIVSKGDVIWVRAEHQEKTGFVAALEQEPITQGALFSVDAKNGHVLAMEGGFDFRKSEFNRAIQALRQPGSAFKPIIYTAALEKGYTPATIIVDSPIVYEDTVTGKWKPSNFEEKFYGDTTFRQALIKSRNVPTIKILQAIEVPFLINYTRRLGMNIQLNPDLSISLGSGAVSLMELTRTYALFPRLGRVQRPIFISSVRDRDGRVLEEEQPQPLPSPQLPPAPQASEGVELTFYPIPDDPDQVIDPRVSYVMTNLMKEVVTYGTGGDARSLGRVSAGKTGTTNDYLDAWYVGFTPTVVTGVWVGNDNQKSLGPGETGARAALPVWLSFMKEAVQGYPDVDFPIPQGVVFATIDSRNGKLAAPNSHTAIKEAFIAGTEPTEISSPDGAGVESQSEFFKEDFE